VPCRYCVVRADQWRGASVIESACILPKAVIRMLPSRQIVARSEDRKYIMRISPISWAGLEWPNPFAGIYAYFTPASPTNRVFLWARFHLVRCVKAQTATLSHACQGFNMANQTKSSSDCAHCQLVCEATTGRPSRLHGVVAPQGEGTRVPNSLTGYCRKAVTGGYLHREKGLTLSGENK
jgi:hypothetical protein